MGKNDAVSKTNKDLELVGNHEAMSKLSPERLGAMLSVMTADEADALTSEYLNIEVSQSIRAVYVEMTEMNGQEKFNQKAGEKIKCAKLILENGTYAINADKVLVSTCENLKPYTPIEIQCTGMDKSSKGEYKKFTIIPLK